MTKEEASKKLEELRKFVEDRGIKRETWNVCKDQEIIYPTDLAADPDKYGGLGMHMAAAIRDKVITIPLHLDGCHVAIQVTDPDIARRIVAEGKVDVLASGWWSCFNSVKAVYHGTDEEIPRWGKTVQETRS